MEAPSCQSAGPQGAKICGARFAIARPCGRERAVSGQWAELAVGPALMMMGRKLLPAGVGVEVGVLACVALGVGVDVGVLECVALGAKVDVGVWLGVALGVGVDDGVGVADGVGVPLDGGVDCRPVDCSHKWMVLSPCRNGNAARNTRANDNSAVRLAFTDGCISGTSSSARHVAHLLMPQRSAHQPAV